MANFNPYGNGFNNFNYMNPYSNNNQFQNYNNGNNNNYQTNQYFYVNGIEGAKSFQMQPNQSIMLMDSDSPLCYMKQANSMGQATLRYFKLVETTEDELKGTSKQPQVNNEYVLKADFDILSKRLDELSKKLEKAKKQENKEE